MAASSPCLAACSSLTQGLRHRKSLRGAVGVPFFCDGDEREKKPGFDHKTS
ncbi:hypothetical protein J2067_002989 [Erwinia rhapontici]|nr:hypothetical protein [Erwinia rhapontici]